MVSFKFTFKTINISHAVDGEKIISGSDDTTVKIWDVSTNDCEITLRYVKNGIQQKKQIKSNEQ